MIKCLTPTAQFPHCSHPSPSTPTPPTPAPPLPSSPLLYKGEGRRGSRAAYLLSSTENRAAAAAAGGGGGTATHQIITAHPPPTLYFSAPLSMQLVLSVSPSTFPYLSQLSSSSSFLFLSACPFLLSSAELMCCAGPWLFCCIGLCGTRLVTRKTLTRAPLQLSP